MTEARAHVKRRGGCYIMARNSSFTYKGRSVDVRQVGRELGVRYVLEGSVRRAKQRVRVAAQLIDALNGVHVWADRFDAASQDIFELQDLVWRAASLVRSYRRCD
jgi:TolB-like protein